MLSKENASAERIEAGPGPEQVAEEKRSETATGPCGDVARHFVCLLILRAERLAFSVQLYVMLPGSTTRRKDWPKIGHTDSRGTEIQRIIGRSLRAAIDLSRIGPHTIALDCQVMQADGGTRTACICAAYVALADAIKSLPR